MKKCLTNCPVFVDHYNIILFGAGASFGSDTQQAYASGLLPPLGKDIFLALTKDTTLPAWSSLPDALKERLSAMRFEDAMAELNADESLAKQYLKRDIQLSLFFSRYRARQTNLYMKLAARISRALALGWEGGVINLNYDRLLEESLHYNRVFSVVRGVQFYDGQIPNLAPHERIEVCYPHGACHFFLGVNPFQGEGDVVLADKTPTEGGGVNHLLIHDHIRTACEERYLPLICRYEREKPASIPHTFLDNQKQRTSEMLRKAESVSIIGVYCSYETDDHLWDALAKSTARIHYFEPFPEPRTRLRDWALSVGKQPERDLFLWDQSFSSGFDEILRATHIEPS